jgi:hypothetical protein
LKNSICQLREVNKTTSIDPIAAQQPGIRRHSSPQIAQYHEFRPPSFSNMGLGESKRRWRKSRTALAYCEDSLVGRPEEMAPYDHNRYLGHLAAQSESEYISHTPILLVTSGW